MLTTYPGRQQSGAAPIDVSKTWWIDLVDPTPAEIATAERICRFTVPTRDELGSIETSSRLSEDNGILYLSMPIVARADAVDEAPSPLGFVLSKDYLVTIRYAELRSFALVADRFAKPEAPKTAIETFTVIAEAMVEVSADALEAAGTELDTLSRNIFPPRKKRLKKKPVSNAALRNVLLDVGNIGERSSRVRDILLGLQRIVHYADSHRALVPPEVHERFATVAGDIASITDYEEHLAGKAQFLLDAVLGLINTKQNDIFTVLTIVSVAGIPPTLVASIYGMNFKVMPELTWTYGYYYALGLIVLSTILPLAWFKWRGWM
jgi:magnesium transporter